MRDILACCGLIAPFASPDVEERFVALCFCFRDFGYNNRNHCRDFERGLSLATRHPTYRLCDLNVFSKASKSTSSIHHASERDVKLNSPPETQDSPGNYCRYQAPQHPGKERRVAARTQSRLESSFCLFRPSLCSVIAALSRKVSRVLCSVGMFQRAVAVGGKFRGGVGVIIMYRIFGMSTVSQSV